jgi:hypothetical protein
VAFANTIISKLSNSQARLQIWGSNFPRLSVELGRINENTASAIAKAG